MKMNILIFGGTGYIGSKLIPQLVAEGHKVRCVVRDELNIRSYPWSEKVEIIEGDVLQSATLEKVFDSIDIIYYLVHSMQNSKGDFADLDRKAAQHVGEQAARAGVKRIIYLGGLGTRSDEQSKHLKSRHEVGDVLRTYNIAVTEFRAAAIIGAGSLSFELIHHLTNR